MDRGKGRDRRERRSGRKDGVMQEWWRHEGGGGGGEEDKCWTGTKKKRWKIKVEMETEL